ncbi:phage terminase large subunit [Leptospira santarosai]|uniref:Phage terminase large subunit n=1 Tax=Leptospira santarosai str. ZUN179 TaxID=1049985 RepID=M6UFD3_9LEPT|nr:phage terminase large subunit [Leptospira santarosai]EMO43807.1 phage terminase large subunit [Leptospira santarosai str. ZUN179]
MSIVLKIIDAIRWNRKQKLGLKILSDPLKRFIKFWGGSRSGKTYLFVRAIRIRALKYPGSKHIICRYSFANAKKTIWLQTILPEIRKDENVGLCRIIQDQGIILYQNGSIVMLGGLEPSAIDSVLASEYATIFVTEANENKWGTIENLMSRLNDTAKDVSGNPIKCMFLIDLNPTVDRSWTNVAWMRGINPDDQKPIKNFHQYANLHFIPEDNEENLSAGYISDTLDNLSSAKRKRFRLGVYGSYAGLVYQIDENEHIVDDFPIPQEWKKIRAIDFGFTHPFVCLWIAYDAANDCAYVYREWRETRLTVRAHSEHIKELSIEDLPESDRNNSESWKMAERIYAATVADHDAEDRATLEENGIKTEPAKKEVLAGIDLVTDLLEHNPETGKRTQVKFFRSCTYMLNGLYSYRWRDQESSAKRLADREVVKEDDDECDAFRYGIMELFPIVKPFQARGHTAA